MTAGKFDAEDGYSCSPMFLRAGYKITEERLTNCRPVEM